MIKIDVNNKKSLKIIKNQQNQKSPKLTKIKNHQK